MDVVLLHNEKAGAEDWSRKRLLRLVRDAGFRPKYFELKEALSHPRALAKGEFVIVAGGDGSVRKTALKLLGRNLPLALLPLGTANNIAHSLGLPDDPEEIVAGWEKPRRRAFDIGLAMGPWGRRRFVEGVGLGLVSRAITVLNDIDDVSEHEMKKAKHKLHRDVCVSAALAHEMPPLQVKVSLDDRDASDDFLLLEILNIRRAGPALELAPNANPCDGRFDVVRVGAHQRWRLMRVLKSRLADEEPPRHLPTRRAAEIRFVPAAACELRIDDRNVPLTAGATVEVTIERGALELVLPSLRGRRKR